MQQVKQWIIASLLSCAALFLQAEELQEKPIVVLIPSYNNSQWYRYNLDSVFAQDYHNYRIIYIDDCSTDGMGDLVDAFVEESGHKERTTVFHNAQRLGALWNTYRGVWACKPDEIVAILDGDDWFDNVHVLKTLNQVYADPDVWTTYGQFRYFPFGSEGFARQVPYDIIEQNKIRHYDWVTTHLRTFYAGLFQKIKLQDLLYENRFFTSAGDLAYTWPIIEMAGRHSRFIPDILYVYNVANQLNDHKVAAQQQIYFTYVIQKREAYLPLDQLFLQK